MPEAVKALESDEQVTVNPVFVPGWLNYYYVFEPTGEKPAKGFIIYPGALVDARVYAPTARRIAAKGYRTVVASMPFNLAIMGYRRADTIISGSVLFLAPVLEAGVGQFLYLFPFL